SAGLLVTARVLNMGAGLLMIPILIKVLRPAGFGAWAVLLAASIAFSTLEMGMPSTLVKHSALPIQNADRAETSRIWGHVLATLGLVYGLFALPVVLVSEPLARLLRIPDDELLTAAEMIVFVYGVVALRAILQTGIY